MAAVTGPKAAQNFCEQRVVPRKPGLSSPIRTEGFIFLYYDEKEHSFMKEQLEKIRQEALGALDGVKDAGKRPGRVEGVIFKSLFCNKNEIF